MTGLCQCGCGQSAPLWTRNTATRGRVKGQAARFIAGHYAKAMPRTDPADRFWAKVNGSSADGCWEWHGYRMPNGYGTFAGGRDGGKVLAHRWAYEALIAPVPQGLDLDHLCRNRGCVNPWHLDPVTRAINLARGEHRNQHTKEKQS